MSTEKQEDQIKEIVDRLRFNLNNLSISVQAQLPRAAMRCCKAVDLASFLDDVADCQRLVSNLEAEMLPKQVTPSDHSPEKGEG